MTPAQEAALQAFNDLWQVAGWKEGDDGALLLTLDDGDTAAILPDGTVEKDW